MRAVRAKVIAARAKVRAKVRAARAKVRAGEQR